MVLLIHLYEKLREVYFFFFVKQTLCDLLGENLKPVWFDQFEILFMVTCNRSWIVFVCLLRKKILRSSANKVYFIGLGIHLLILLIAIRNSVAEIHDPCVIPFSCVNVSETVLLILT